MPLELVTIPRVPVCRTGHYDLQSGPVDFSLDHFTAAAAALENDPAVLPMRIRMELPDQGHLEADAMAVEAAGGMGGPAIGWADNYAVEGNTIYADFHVPDVVAASMEWAFPGRSIEGLFGYTTATGQRHEFMATGVLLLGTSWPGVTTLPDFAEVQAEFAADVAEGLIAQASYATASGPAQRQHLQLAAVAARQPAEGRVPGTAREQLATAGLNVADLRLRWYGAESAGDLADLPESYDYYSWYVLEVRADDDGSLFVLVLDESDGRLWRFDVDAISGPDVTWSSPTEVVMEVMPVAARAADARRPAPALARFNSRTESRSVRAAGPNPPNQEDDSPMTDEQRRALAVSMGLAPDTTEADLHAEATRRASVDQPDPANTPGATTEGDAPGTAQTEPSSQEDLTPAGDAVTARTQTISTETLAGLQRDAAEGVAARQRQTHADRDRAITAAIEDGRITPAESGLGEADPQTGLHAIEDGWRRDLEDAPEVTARALARLTTGKFPGAQARRGAQPQSEDNPGSLNRARAAAGLSTSKKGD